MNTDFIKLFKYGARNGDLNVMQKILNIPSNIFSIQIFEDTFNDAYLKNHLVMTKWLCEIKPDINISAENDYVFRFACENGHLVIAKWLYKIKPDIKISAEMIMLLDLHIQIVI
jgi:hypothetical protein